VTEKYLSESSNQILEHKYCGFKIPCCLQMFEIQVDNVYIYSLINKDLKDLLNKKREYFIFARVLGW